MHSQRSVQTVGNVPSRSHPELEVAYVGNVRARADELARDVSRNCGVTLDCHNAPSTGTCKWRVRS